MNADDLFEMSNFNYRTTGLPSYIEVCTRSDPSYHGHDRYRIKVTKNKDWAGIFTLGQSPKMVKDINQSLTHSDINELLNWIKAYSTLLISHIDDKIDSAELSLEIQKIRGAR